MAITGFPVPDGRSYLPYQTKGIRYALMGKGTLFADEMGLGKTIQAIGVINASSDIKRVLVICPPGLIVNWHNEIADWCTRDNVKFTIEGYYQANKRAQSLNDESYWDLLIVDEAHYIKNADTQRAKAVKAISLRCKRNILLTGTPIENRPIELWPLLQIVAPQYWDPPNASIGVISAEQKKTHPGEGPNFWAFAKRYCDLKKRSFRKGRQIHKAWDFTGASNLSELQDRLRKSCMVRRLKSEVLEQLPPKRRQVIVLPSNEDDSKLFPDLNADNYFDVIKRLTANRVQLTEFSRKRHAQALKKVDQVISFIEDALDSSQKIILFAHHGDVIAKLASAFTAMGYQPAVVTGKTHKADRGAEVRRFQEDPQCRLFIGSIGAAGVGITLTAASHVVFAELDPVPGRVTQAEDRAHRIGQRESVLVQHLVLNRSLCARMAKILVRKQSVISAALDGRGHLSSEERALAENFFGASQND